MANAENHNSEAMEVLNTLGSGFQNRRADFLLLILPVCVLALVAVQMVRSDRVGLEWEKGRVVQVQDFASHVRFSQQVWRSAPLAVEGSPYTPAFHRRFMARWSKGAERAGVLPFGYAPTIFLLWAPFGLLDLSVAYLMWTGLGLLGLTGVFIHRRTLSLSVAAVMITPVALVAVRLGQTALLSTAALFYLMDRSLTVNDRLEGPQLGLMVAVLWALTAKPPLALLAGSALLATRQWRPVAYAAGLTVGSTTLLTPMLGASWPADYLNLISTYDTAQTASIFVPSLEATLGTMSNLRSFLHLTLGVSDSVAAQASTGTWISSIAIFVWAGWKRKIDGRVAWALAVLTYLLFCSHVIFTDDLHLLLVPAALLPWHEVEDAIRYEWAAWIAAPVALVLTPGIGLTPGFEPLQGIRPAPLFVIKLAIIGWVLWVSAGGRGTAQKLGSARPAT